MTPYYFKEHTADIAMVATGKTLEELFAHAAEGLASALLDTRADGRWPAARKHIELDAPSAEDLLVEWLNELIYFFFTERFLFSSVASLSVRDGSLSADVEGAVVPYAEAARAQEIKAATYHDVTIRRATGSCTVEIILDR